MLKTVDVGLMANHLAAHKGIIKKLEFYAASTQNKQLSMLIEQQAGLMKNHVTTMNNLLNPNQMSQATLPPIPKAQGQNHANMSGSTSIGLKDPDIAMDAHFTATAMANDNFTSAMNMKDPQVKKIHIEMALQQSHIAEQLEMMGNQNGWMSHPSATSMEQTNAQQPMGDSTHNMNTNKGQIPVYNNQQNDKQQSQNFPH
ncbi:spore coat protein [Aquibacillus sp. 3ASR75-11]|uniref:Spore coat protein n=1 Tax=Terrihalobacillus insolitus TaxID=2950438 RepID=A0A9X3WT19_9BACI|nr:spore coat protein [Terrihalobacillus insolitus]MDC3414038.1 spore coat protein [Terrihalobacillus insolitus]MDC3424128.1 spore coat protein [Terrihalobacillus insolitus]